MRNIAINDVDHLPRRVLGLGSDYPPDTLLPRHHHRRAQFLYAVNGLMKVETDDGQWLVPPFSGVWIPANKPHCVWMPGVSTHSLYIEPQDAPRAGYAAKYCRFRRCYINCYWPPASCRCCMKRADMMRRLSPYYCLNCRPPRRCRCLRRYRNIRGWLNYAARFSASRRFTVRRSCGPKR